jgi:hypothetical protein
MPTLFAKARTNRLYALQSRCTPNSLFPVTAIQEKPLGVEYLLYLAPNEQAWVSTADIDLVSPYLIV